MEEGLENKETEYKENGENEMVERKLKNGEQKTRKRREAMKNKLRKRGGREEKCSEKRIKI
jgi:hypothetical protein